MVPGGNGLLIARGIALCHRDIKLVRRRFVTLHKTRGTEERYSGFKINRKNTYFLLNLLIFYQLYFYYIKIIIYFLTIIFFILFFYLNK